MTQIKLSEKARRRWQLVNEADRQMLMLEIQYQTMQYVKNMRSVAYFFFVLAFLGILVSFLI